MGLLPGSGHITALEQTLPPLMSSLQSQRQKQVLSACCSMCLPQQAQMTLHQAASEACQASRVTCPAWQALRHNRAQPTGHFHVHLRNSRQQALERHECSVKCSEHSYQYLGLMNCYIAIAKKELQKSFEQQAELVLLTAFANLLECCGRVMAAVFCRWPCITT